MPKERLGRQNGRREHYERFPAAEVDRRRAAVRAMMDEADLDALVLYGTAGNEGSHVRYLTNYAPTFATYVVFFRDPAEESLLLVGLSNHVQYVREVSEVGEVDVMLHDPPGRVADRIEAAGSAVETVGVVGHDPRYDLTMPHEHHAALSTRLDAELVDATGPFTRVHAVKSEAERSRIRAAASALDAGVEAFAAAIEPGATEHDLADAFADACEAAGGTATLDFITTAPMTDAEPGAPLTWHHPSSRSIRDGDVVTMELSAAVGGYSSQVHRPFVVGREPTEAYAEMYDLIEDAYERMVSTLVPGNSVADVHAALADVEDSGYKTYDVSLHGYGNGYLHPFVGIESSNYWPGADDPLTESWTFEEGMVLVVQPNVTNAEETRCLQLGSAVVVDDEPEVLQEYPVRFTRV